VAQTPYTISFQYIEPGDDQPRTGYEIFQGEVKLPEGASVPRVGEFITLHEATAYRTFEVLAVNTLIVILDTVGWHAYVTVGPVKPGERTRLSAIQT
jgi:hypothetical protein